MRYLSLFVLAICCAGISRAQVSVKAAVDHIIPDGIDNIGNITLTVSGSTSPYTYTWNPGAINTQNLSNISAGSYSLQVKSASAQTYTNTYSLGYKVLWTNLNQCTLKNDTLTSTSIINVVHGSAISRNTLPANTDGWVEFVYDAKPTNGAYIGFLDSISPYNGTLLDMDFGIFVDGANNRIRVYENAASTVIKNTPVVGDVIRVERLGNTVNYKINGVILKSTTASGIGAKVWKLKSALQMSSRWINIGCSFANLGNTNFKNYVTAVTYPVHNTDASSTDGGFFSTPRVPFANTYLWQPGGITTNTVSGLNPGSYTLTLTDSLSNTSNTVYNVGYKVRWTNLNQCVLKHDTLLAVGTVGTYREANSKNTLAAGQDGWVEYVLNSLGGQFAVGFCDNLSLNPLGFGDIDVGLLYNSSFKYFYLQEFSNSSTIVANIPKNGDVVRIERVGDVVNYKINGVTLRTVTIPGISQAQWKIKASLNRDASLINVGCSFLGFENTDFPGYVRLNPSIIHSSPNSTDGSVTVTPRIPFANTYTWTPQNTTGPVLSGLSPGTYSVIVRDSLNNRSTCWYNVGNKVSWTGLSSATLKQDTLTGTSTSWGSAYSQNVLAPGTNGWVEFLPKSFSKPFMIGFIDSIQPSMGNSASDIDYGFEIYNQGGTVYFYENNTLTLYATIMRTTDLLRIERNADTIVYRLNGVKVKSTVVTGISQKTLWVKAALNNKAQVSHIGCSFPIILPITMTASVTNYQSENSKGQIQYTVTGGAPPYNIAWQGSKLPSSTVVYHALIDSMPGTVIDSVAFKAQIDALKQQTLYTGLNPGTYTTSVYSNAPDSAIVISTVGGPDSLGFARGITTSLGSVEARTVNGTVYNYGKGLTLTQQGTYSTGNHYAMLRAGFDSQTGGAINFVVPAASTKASVGLQEKKDGVDGYPDEMMVRTMFRLNGNGTFDIIYQNATVSSGSVAAGDMFSIRKEASGTKLGYYKNETLLIEKEFSTIAPATGLIGKAILGGASAALGPINVSLLFAPSVSISTVDMVCGDNCVGKITSVGSSGFVPSNPYSYALFDASGLLLSTVSVTSTANTATFQNLCAGKYTVKYTYQETPLYDLNSGSAPAPVTKTISQSVDIGYMPSWTNLANATDITPNHSLQKITGATQAWNAGASTFNTLKAGAPETHWMEWSANAVADDQNCFGLTGADVGTNPFALDFHGIYLYRSGKTNFYNLLSGGSALLNGAGTYTENDKFRIEKTVSGSTYSIVFKKNNVVIGQVNSIVNKDFVADASIYRLNDKIYLPRLSFGCPDAPVYAILKRELDGGYYQVMNKELYFKYTEEYADQDGKLLFNVYNDQNQRVVNGTSLGALTPSVAYGDNYYRVDLGNTGYSGGQSLPAGYYLLEVVNEKNEKWYVRFKK